MTSRRKIVAGNWKLNGDLALVNQFDSYFGQNTYPNVDVIVCAPSVYLQSFRHFTKLGAQNVAFQDSGAFTGEVSAAQLGEVGAKFVLVGHSERRELFNECNKTVATKFARVLDAGLTPILCVGESLDTRQAGNLFEFIETQLQAVVDKVGIAAIHKSVIAYEPIWAIGTGETASPEQAQEVHAFIRSWFAEQDAGLASKIQILYGGSVNAKTAPELFAQPDIDGGLVGGASLKIEEFKQICQAANN